MSTRLGVALMAFLLAVYIVLVAQRGWLLIVSGNPIGIAMGVTLAFLPVLAAWALWRELTFGRQSAALMKRLEAEGGLPADEVNVSSTGRPSREDADRVFPLYRADAEARPTDWRAWMRLGLVYSAAGDRTRARSAVRRAIAADKAEKSLSGR